MEFGLRLDSLPVAGDLSSIDDGMVVTPFALRLFWDAYAVVYDAIWDSVLTQRVGELLSREVRRVRRRAMTGRIVDLGCGTGLGAQSLADGNEKVVGVDTSGAMLRRAERLGRIDVGVRSDVVATGLPTSLADVVLVGNVLQVHATPASVLAEAARLLVAGGLMVCVWPREGLTLSGLLLADLFLGRSIRIPWCSPFAPVRRCMRGSCRSAHAVGCGCGEGRSLLGGWCGAEASRVWHSP